MVEDDYKVVDLSSGQFRAERLLRDGDDVSYRSATFGTRQEAQQWIALQRQSPTPPVALRYVVTPTDTGTLRVSLWLPDRIEELGEFDTEAEAKEFVRLMLEYDGGRTG
jgi:hypothetical protein